MKLIYFVLLLEFPSLWAFIHTQGDSISHYSVRGTAFYKKNQYAEAVGADLYFIKNSSEVYKGILKNLQLGDNYFAREFERDANFNKTEYLKVTFAQSFFFTVNELGKVMAHFVADNETPHWENPLSWIPDEYYGILSFDKALRNAMQNKVTEFEDRATIGLDGNDRICTKVYRISHDDPVAINVKMTVDSHTCQTDDQLSRLSGPHAWGYMIEVDREFFKTDFTLRRMDVFYQLLERKQRPSKQANVTIQFEEFREIDEKIFSPPETPETSETPESKVGPMEVSCSSIKPILPFKPGFDLKFQVTGYFNDFDDIMKPDFTLHLRESGNDTYLFGRITDLSFSNDSITEEDKKSKIEVVKTPFLLGFVNDTQFPLDKSLTYKFLKADSDGRPIIFREIYQEAIVFEPNIPKLLQEQIQFTEVPVSLHTSGKRKCIKTFEVSQDEAGYENVAVKMHTDKCRRNTGLFGDTKKSLKMIVDNVYKMKDGKWYGARFNGQLINDRRKDESLYVDMKIDMTFVGYTPREENDKEVFQLSGKVIDETFFHAPETNVILP